MDLIHELPTLLAISFVVCALTAAVSLTLGRLIARRSQLMSVVVCSLFWPLAPCLGVGLLFLVGAVAPPPHDGPAMAAVSAILLAAVSFPFALMTSCIVLLRPNPRRSGR